MITAKLYLFLFLLFFYFLTFFIRSYLHWKMTGLSPFVFVATDDAYGFNGKLFTYISALALPVVGLYAFGGKLYSYLLPFWYLENIFLQTAGWGLLHVALVWVFTAQWQMAHSFRIGIDFKNKTPLVTRGLFSVSRNPIFLGILLTYLGLFLILPNAFTLLILIWSHTVLGTQVRLEEAYLKEIHGAGYLKYIRQVRRWI